MDGKTVMRIRRIELIQVSIPYDAPVGPYRGGGGRRSAVTTGASSLLAKLETDSGTVGWGEGKGRFETDPNAVLVGHHLADIEGALAAMKQAGIGAGPASAVEMALWDALGRATELPLCRLMGGVVREEVDFCACMGLKPPSESAATAREYVRRWGFRFLKTKAGNDIEEDLGIAAAIQQAVGDGAVLRPDANSGYTPEQAEGLLRQMAELGVRYFEDPCGSEHLEALVRFRQEIGIGILVNMGVSSPESVPPILAAGAADFLMPDTPAAGGILPVKKIAAVAEAYGVPCLMHCSHDLGLKTAAVAHIAASTPNFSGPSDTCYHGLRDDILTEPLHFESGKLSVPMRPGLGVVVDESRVQRYRVG
jgi:L-alanine-DL-glutamate epimerase-like enolase superfamily enzyme